MDTPLSDALSRAEPHLKGPIQIVPLSQNLNCYRPTATTPFILITNPVSVTSYMRWLKRAS